MGNQIPYGTDWRAASVPETLSDSAVHIWRAELNVSLIWLDHYSSLLNQDESARAARFRFPQLTERYVTARGILRTLLAAYLHTSPAAVEFTYNEWGKPTLTPPNDLRFNISHSEGWALYAFTRSREIGIDIEKINRSINTEEISRHFFSSSERHTLLSLPPEDQHSAFFHCWSRKEAYIKAVGKGLSLGLDTFDVSILPDDPPRLLGTRPDPAEAARWTMAALHPHPDFRAALVLEGSPLPLTLYHFLPGMVVN